MTLASTPFELLLATSRDALWVWDCSTDQAQWGAAWLTMTGTPAATPLKAGIAEWQDRLHPDERAGVLQLFQLHLDGASSIFESEHRIATQDGDYRWVFARARCQRDSQGKLALVAGSFTDISDQKILDPYTKLPNRIHFLDRLERSISRLRFGGSHAVGVLAIQIHLQASQADLLSQDEQIELGRLLGERISSELRPWDFVAQLDALEFTILLEMVASGTDLSAITDRLLQALRHPFQIGQHEILIGAAIGSADSASARGNEEHILRAAEDAAHLAASQGNFRHVAYDPATHDQLAHHQQIEEDIVAALIDQQFEPWFQPIVQISDGRILGFEALVRWPRRGVILEPRQFLPFMERGGLINQLSWIMLQRGLEAHEEWIEKGLIDGSSRLGVNLPADQLFDPRLAEQIGALLEDSDLSASRLRLEVQEKNLLRPNPAIHDNLAALREQGAQIVIDDAGRGQMSLKQLQHFPLDGIKIHRALITGLEHSESCQQVVRMLIALAGAMHLPVVAKGVESRAQLAILREAGIEQVQGYLYATPLREADVPGWLASHNAERTAR